MSFNRLSFSPKPKTDFGNRSVLNELLEEQVKYLQQQRADLLQQTHEARAEYQNAQKSIEELNAEYAEEKRKLAEGCVEIDKQRCIVEQEMDELFEEYE